MFSIAAPARPGWKAAGGLNPLLSEAVFSMRFAQTPSNPMRTCLNPLLSEAVFSMGIEIQRKGELAGVLILF